MTTTRTEPFYRHLGQLIARARQEKSLSQKDLGEALSPRLTRASIANIETGKQRVMAHALVQLARVLGIDLNALAAEAVRAEHPVAERVAEELRKKLPHGANVVALERSLELASRAAARRRVRQ